MKKIKRSPIPRPRTATNRLVLQSEPCTETQHAAAFRLLCFVSGMLECLDELKGTSYYSKKMEDALNAFQTTKGDKIYWHNQGSLVADISAKDLAMYTSFLNRLYKVGLQPDEVLKRFSDTIENAFIVAGAVDEDNFEPLKIEAA